MQIVNVTPDVGEDLQSTDTSFTLTFTDAVVESEYTRTDVEPTGGERHLIDQIRLYAPQAKNAKNVAPNGSLPIALAFNEDRTELTITPEQGLRDGFIYTLDVGTVDDPTTPSDEGTGLYDLRFKSDEGARFAPNPNFPREQFEFSVGQNESAPALTSVSFDAESNSAGADTLENGYLDYTNSTVTIPLQVDEIDNSAAEVKGYEVYYRSQNQAGRSSSGDQFVKVDSPRPEADYSDFEDASGIIPASAVENDGEVDFKVSVGDYPFAGNDGSYGPIEWKVRAVSINNVRGEFSDVITTGDNKQPALWDVSDYTYNDNGNVESVTIEFTESLDSETVSTSAFTVTDDNGDPVALSSVNLENVQPDQGGDTTVLLTLTNPPPYGNLQEVVVNDAESNSPVKDLAGNGVNPARDRDFF